MTRYQYPYPQVQAPHSSQVYHLQDSTQQPNNHTTRYSWVETPIDAERRRYTQMIQAQNAPPLPSLPEQYHAGIQAQQAAHQRQHSVGLAKTQESEMSQEAYTATAGHKKQLSLICDTKQGPQPPEPVRQLRHEPSWPMSIEPDENPLSPSTVSPISPFRSTTNITCVTPSSHPKYNNTNPPCNYNPVPQPVRGGSWKYSLCSCAEPTICMTGLFCPCILYGRVQHRLHTHSERKDATNMLGYNAVNGSCLAWAVMCGINGILSGLQKRRVRKAYDMDSGADSCFSDCMEGCCCCCCVLARNEKEVKHREEEGRGMGDCNKEGYVATSGMIFSPPPRNMNV